MSTDHVIDASGNVFTLARITKCKDEYHAMKTFVIDASGFEATGDVYVHLLAVLAAPDWHGHNLDALCDSITSGSINGVVPPYTILVRGHDRVPSEVAILLARIQAVFDQARRDQGSDVALWLA